MKNFLPRWASCRQFARWLTDKYICVMLLIFPLFTGFEGYSSITEYKYAFFVMATVLWLLPVSICGVFRLIHSERVRISLTGAQWSVLAFMAASVLSALFSPYPDSVLMGAARYDGLVTLLLYGGVFLGISALGEMQKKYVYIFALSVSLCCAVAMLQLFCIDIAGLFPEDLTYYDGNTYYTGEFLGTIGNTNLLSGMLSLAVPLFAAVFIVSHERKRDVLLLVPVCMGVFILMAAKVSGGIVALAGWAVIAIPLLLRSGKRVCRGAAALFAAAVGAGAGLSFSPEYTGRVFTPGFDLKLFALILAAAAACCLMLCLIFAGKKCRLTPEGYSRVFALMIFLAVIAGLTAVYFWPGNTGTVYEFSQVLHGNVSDSFGSSRIRIWRECLALFGERPVLGGGPDTLSLRLDLTFTRYIEELDFTRVTYVDNAHNEYLGYLINLGVVGMTAYLAIMAFSFVRLVRSRHGTGEKTAFGCAVVCYWIQSFFGLGLCVVAPFLWILWALFESGENKKQ